MTELVKVNKKSIQVTEVNPYTQLTLKQKRYVEARLQGIGPTAACRVAGSDPKNVGDFEHNPNVAAAIRWMLKESTKNVQELTKDDVLSGMMDAVGAAATAAELVMAWREIGKLLGVYEPERKVLEVHDYSANELKMLSDAELAQLAGKSMANVIDGEFSEGKLPVRADEGFAGDE